MPVRLVEGQLPYTGGEGISIDENKVISLNLRDENNLIIYDQGDDEIYVDLQLPAGIKPNYAFPVGVTTGRVLVADDWDVTGTIIVAKTTSGDVIKLLYGDDGTLWMDNGTGLYKQIYFKGDVDVIIQSIQTQIDALSGLGKFLSLWNGETGLPISFPLSTPYEYHTGDWFMINVVDNTTNYRPDGTEFDGTASTTVETSAIEIGDVYIYDGTAFLLQKNGGGGGSAVLFSQVLGDPYSNTNLASALNDKQDELIAGTNINIDSSTNTISATDTTYSAGAGLSLTGTTFSNTARFSPDSAGTQGQVLTKGASGYDWATVSGGDVQVSTDTGNLLTTGVKLWLGDKADFDNLGTLDSNTIYAPAIGTRTPGANTLVYYPLETNVNDYSGNNRNLTNTGITFSDGVGVFNGSAVGTYTNNSLWNGLTEFTYSVYVYTTSIPSGQIDDAYNRARFMFIHQLNSSGVFDKALYLYDSSKIAGYNYDEDNSEEVRVNATGISTNTWCHIAYTWDGTTMKIYKNGVLADSTACTSSFTGYTNATFTLGWNESLGWMKTFQGKLSKAIVEDKAWTANEINNYFNQTKAQYGIS